MAKSRLSLNISLFVVAFWVLQACFPVRAFAVTQITPVPERERGIELLSQRKFKDASKIFRKAVEKNKTDPEGWYYLGMALLEQENETKNASKAFETALKLRPDFTAARTGLSYAFLLRNKLFEAMREAHAVLIGHPGIAEAHYIIGVVRLRSGAQDEALKEAGEAIRLNPQMAGAYLLKSQALMSIYRTKTLSDSQTIRGSSSELTSEERVERRNRRKQGANSFIQAAESLETYLRLNPSDSSIRAWQEQLATLKVFARYGEDKPNDNDAVYSGDEITTKARVLAKPEPTYTEAARRAGVTGTVVLRAVFAADGTVRHILILQGLPNGLTEQALKAVRLIKFVPATIDGRPVSMFIQLEYNFYLH